MRSPRVEAMLSALFAHEDRGSEYWEELSALVTEATTSSIVRTFVVASCRDSLERADSATNVRIFDVLDRVRAPLVPLAVRFARHPDDAVRCAVACAIEDSRDPRAIDVLASLCRDASPHVSAAALHAMVRGYGVPGDHDFVDTPVVRDALASCLADASVIGRSVAIVGLAMRRDPRAVAPLHDLLWADELNEKLVDAAYYLAAPELRDALQRHIDAGSDVCGEWSLEDAVAACTVDLR